MSVRAQTGASAKTKRRSVIAQGNGVLDVHQAGKFLGAHAETIRRMARRHEIPAYKMGRDWRFRKSALQHWSETHYLRTRESVILVVDDEANIRNLVRRILKPEGYRVFTAADGTEALAAAQRDMPDVLILDLKMRGMTGVEVLRQLRQMQPDLPVIVLTGYPESQMIAETLRYPPVTLLLKPVENEVMLKTVRQILDGALEGRKNVSSNQLSERSNQ
jgi:excisionase family DNA binding protein